MDAPQICFDGTDDVTGNHVNVVGAIVAVCRDVPGSDSGPCNSLTVMRDENR